MSNKQNRKKKLIEALASKDKDKLRKALSINKPDKWICFEINHNKKLIKYENRIISEDKMKLMLEEACKESQIHLVVMNIDRREGGISEVWDIYEPEIVINFVKAQTFNDGQN